MHWDDNDPNRFIYAPVTVTGDMNEDTLAQAVASQGFRVVSIGSDNVGRGHAYVSRIRSDWSFYDPIDSDWHAYLSDERKAAIAEKYPDASVPGTEK